MLDREECALALQYLFAGAASLGFSINCFKVGSSTREHVINETFDDDFFSSRFYSHPFSLAIYTVVQDSLLSGALICYFF